MRAISRKTRNIGMALLAAAALVACGDSGKSADDSSATSAAEASDAMPAGGYAAKLKMPKKRPEHSGVQLAEVFLNNAQIPAADDVNIPAYPGAKIVSTMAGGQFKSSSGEGKSLPGMILLSSDELDTVLAFYKDKLAGWQYQEFYGIHTFWDGPEGARMMEIIGRFPSLTLGDIEEGDVMRLLWPEMRTKMDMMYDKPGN